MAYTKRRLDLKPTVHRQPVTLCISTNQEHPPPFSAMSKNRIIQEQSPVSGGYRGAASSSPLSNPGLPRVTWPPLFCLTIVYSALHLPTLGCLLFYCFKRNYPNSPYSCISLSVLLLSIFLTRKVLIIIIIFFFYFFSVLFLS